MRTSNLHENGDLLLDQLNTLNGWKNYFCQLLNVQGNNNIRPTEIHDAEPLFLILLTLALPRNLRRCKLLGIDQIRAKVSQAEDRTLHSLVYNLSSSV